MTLTPFQNRLVVFGGNSKSELLKYKEEEDDDGLLGDVYILNLSNKRKNCKNFIYSFLFFFLFFLKILVNGKNQKEVKILFLDMVIKQL